MSRRAPMPVRRRRTPASDGPAAGPPRRGRPRPQGSPNRHHLSMAPSPHPVGVPGAGPGMGPPGLLGAEAELARLRDLVMHAPAMMWILRGAAHVVELANEPAQQAARGAAEVVGRPACEALPDLVRQGLLAL